MAAEPLVQTPSPSPGGRTASSGSSRWATIRSASTARASPAAQSSASKTPTATASTTSRPCFSTSSPFPPACCPGATACSSPALRTSSIAEDTDGDGKADKREVLFTGFSEGNQQHRVNSLVWGLDNWIYCANGDSGGAVKSLKTGNGSRHHAAATSASGRMTGHRSNRNPARRSTAAAATTGATGSATTTANPMYHFVLDDHYHAPQSARGRSRRAGAGVGRRRAAAQSIRSADACRVSTIPARANHFTSACSAIVYRDDLFGPALPATPSSASRCTTWSIARS